MLIALDRAAEALPLLTRLLEAAIMMERHGDEIHYLVLIALAQHALGNTQTALDSLSQALTLAEPQGYVRLFVDEGLPMAELLNFAISQNIAPDYASKLLAAFPKDILGEVQIDKELTVNTQMFTLVANNARLLDYVREGGTMVVQYGQYEMMQPGIMPYPITINRPHDRVTIEGSPVRITDPSAPVLAAPNRITEADFAGWVQDRSLYMPRTFDARYRAMIEMNDPGEPPSRGALLVAAYGRGTYVYTTMAFFRQLPNGVPGAARLFVNLLAAKAPRTAQ